MRLLVIGAGASYAECKAANLPDAQCMPLMKDLSRKLWADYQPTSFLEEFLKEIGDREIVGNPVQIFQKLELSHPNLIEQFFEFAWSHRNEYQTPYSRCWDDLMYHGLLVPLNFILSTGLLANNPETRFPLSESVAQLLAPDDLVLNLNYDLIFDVALKNVGKEATYSPNPRRRERVWAFKPHGSFHLAVDEERRGFCFGQVEFIGDMQPAGTARTFLGFVPPRINKNFSASPVAQMILEPLWELKPDIVSFWGIGSPASDADLFRVYNAICAGASRIEYVNPSDNDAEKFGKLLGKEIVHFRTVDQWMKTSLSTI